MSGEEGEIFRLVAAPQRSKRARVDPLEAVRASGVLHLFEKMEKTPVPEASLKPYFPRGLPGIDFASFRPRLKKPKILGTRLERVEAVGYHKIEPLDPLLLKEALTFKPETTARGGKQGEAKKTKTTGTKKEQIQPQKKRSKK